jgi:signal peptidase I
LNERDARLRAAATFAVHRDGEDGGWVEVSGSSMRPLIHEGDTLYVDFEARPRLGEIVVFAEAGRIVAHRVVGRKRTGGHELLLTRGDATVRFDAPVAAERTFGVVRACRRSSDGALTPILDRGFRAAALALVSRAGAGLVHRSDRLRGPLNPFCQRVARKSVARTAELLIRLPS